jgi:hypothetical protein
MGDCLSSGIGCGVQVGLSLSVVADVAAGETDKFSKALTEEAARVRERAEGAADRIDVAVERFQGGAERATARLEVTADEASGQTQACGQAVAALQEETARLRESSAQLHLESGALSATVVKTTDQVTADAELFSRAAFAAVLARPASALMPVTCSPRVVASRLRD